MDGLEILAKFGELNVAEWAPTTSIEDDHRWLVADDRLEALRVTVKGLEGDARNHCALAQRLRLIRVHGDCGLSGGEAKKSEGDHANWIIRGDWISFRVFGAQFWGTSRLNVVRLLTGCGYGSGTADFGVDYVHRRGGF